MLFRKLLLPLDTSPSSEASVRYARDIAAAANGELYLLHVAKESLFRQCRYGWPTEARVSSSATRPAPSRLILPGTPAQTIVDYAEHLDADVIMMPTRGYGILGQLLLGSTTMDVIRSTTRSVWVTKRRSLTRKNTFSCKRIVCGIDISTEGQAVLNYAARAARAWTADLIVVHAIPGISDAMLMLYGLDETGEIELLPSAARRKARAMAAHIQVPFLLDVSIGDPAQCLRRAVAKHHADLVIIGRGRQTNRWRIGANIGEIIARSNCPVITCPPRVSTRLTHGMVRRMPAQTRHAHAAPFEQPHGCESLQPTL